MVTHTDLLGLERADAFAFGRALDRASDAAALAARLRSLPDVARGLVDAGVDPLHVGHVIASSIDAATQRLIELAVSELGDPPGPWAWLALGSQARREQALKTDQDHALAFHPGGGSLEEADRFFAEVAMRVTDGLEAAGIPRCRGGVMAENPAWRKTADAWAEEFRARITEPSVETTVFTSIAFDYRRVAGALAVDRAIDEAVRGSAHHLRFVRRLSKVAIDIRPPTGFFRDLVVEASGEHVGTLNVKAGGITPLTSIARAHAARSGFTGNTTIQRLRSAAAAGRLDAALAADLEEAFRLLWRIRLEHQVAQAAAGEPPDDHLDPKEIGSFRRVGLKEAFRTIARAQRDLARDMGLMRA